MSGIHRTIDGGESWHLFMDGMVGTGIQDLVSVNNRFYALTKGDIVQSTDGGESWSTVRVNVSEVNPKPLKEGHSRLNFSAESRLTIAGNTLYVITPEKDDLRVFRLSVDGNALFRLKGFPLLKWMSCLQITRHRNRCTYLKSLKKAMTCMPYAVENMSGIGAFVVSGETFYTEYQRKLFKWQPGNAAWKDTGLVDTGEQLEGDLKCGFRLAVSGETVYVGTRDGKLFQSQDSGSSWKDITPNLPLPFTCFKGIVFASSTVYIATDAGVLASDTGVHWRVIANEVVIDRFAVDGARVYGAGDKGVYRLGVHGDWKQISPGVPGKVLSLVVDRDRLYVATERRGMFHIVLEEDNYLVNY